MKELVLIIQSRWSLSQEIISCMKDIAIYGAGGFGREMACAIQRLNSQETVWNFLGFFDDGIDKGAHNQYGEILGGIEELNRWNSPIAILIAIATSSIRKIILEKIHNNLVDFPNFVLDFRCADPNNYFLGKGNIILGTFFSCNVRIQDFNIFNGGAVLGHDDEIGSYNTFMPGTRISGEVHIGDENLFGVGSIVLQKIYIGNKVRVGAGSVLMRKTKDGNLYIGNPARLFKY